MSDLYQLNCVLFLLVVIWVMGWLGIYGHLNMNRCLQNQPYHYCKKIKMTCFPPISLKSCILIFTTSWANNTHPIKVKKSRNDFFNLTFCEQTNSTMKPQVDLFFFWRKRRFKIILPLVSKWQSFVLIYGRLPSSPGSKAVNGLISALPKHHPF